MMARYTVIDLFAGAGGLSLGFHQADLGFQSIMAVEHDAAAARTYKVNFGGHVVDGPIEAVDIYPAADVIIGGPPCQGFSPLGRNRDAESRAELNGLWRHFINAVARVQPKVFVIENVPEFLASEQFQILASDFATRPELTDYRLQPAVLNAADHGVPQRRRRAITIGSRVGVPEWESLRASHGPRSVHGTPYMTVGDAIGDLPDEPTETDLHWSRNPRPMSLERYRAVPEGGNRFDLAANRPDLLPACWANKPTGTTDVFGRLWWDRPALTIRTEFFKPEKGRYLHPRAHRPITHREAARLQTFPDTFTFEGSRIEIARQIGNAVPPRLAQVAANEVHRLLAGMPVSGDTNGLARPASLRGGI